MNKRLVTSASVLTAGLILAPIFATTASATDVAAYTSGGYVSFEAGGTVTPVDPLNPQDLITPTDPDGTDPDPGTAAPLSIDFASSLSFGKQAVSGINATYYAHAQYISKDKDGTDVDETRPNYVQVTDNRGTQAGWTLTVAEAAQFTSDDSDAAELDGAQLFFYKGRALGSNSYTPKYVATNEQEISTSATKIMAAAIAQGMGTWAYRWGDNSDYQENGGGHLAIDAISTKSPITLKVPGGAAMAKVYKTELIWTLSDVPET
ncbi:WxL domain-containing protein [Pseudolactococcus reticulitermitis]|uniref:WxL domain-containing protein n=1 Tax=Pseudolactococcus reticulitermitis TaxID=2025039 RepID=A0A224X9T5_9LACT|nr:WxL domain-containing protein [Lactococcus reticulitermitis]GAX48030.1 hypothetical protein RsY01_1644 [Lactococcus reticulitermitis]